MSAYKDHINKLYKELEAFKYFQEERLKLLKIGFDLQIANRELQDLIIESQEINEAKDAVLNAKNSFDTMFARYESAIINFDRIRTESIALLNYLQDLEKQVNATQEL